MSAEDWTEERITFLRKHWAGLSNASLARELNKLPGGFISRSAVIGKGHRLRLPPKGKVGLYSVRGGNLRALSFWQGDDNRAKPYRPGIDPKPEWLRLGAQRQMA